MQIRKGVIEKAEIESIFGLRRQQSDQWRSSIPDKGCIRDINVDARKKVGFSVEMQAVPRD